MMNKRLFRIAAAGAWITVSEFVRNELLFKSFWTDHYRALGLRFETLPQNGILWVAWSFLLAYVLSTLLSVCSFRKSVFLAWLSAFLMMWIVVYNLQVLPLGLLATAAPLSAVEVAVAGWILKKQPSTGGMM